MKKVLTIPSLLVNSFLVMIFAAYGANTNKKAEILSYIDSEILVSKNNSAKSPKVDNLPPKVLPQNPDLYRKFPQTEICQHIDSEIFIPKNNLPKSSSENDSHAMVVPKNPNLERKSYSMIILDCPTPEE